MLHGIKRWPVFVETQQLVIRRELEGLDMNKQIKIMYIVHRHFCVLKY